MLKLVNRLLHTKNNNCYQLFFAEQKILKVPTMSKCSELKKKKDEV